MSSEVATTAPARSSALEIAVAAALFLGTLALYLSTITRTELNSDPYANSLSAWQIAHTGRPWMEGLDLTEPGVVRHFVPGRDGHTVTTSSPGPKLVAVPFYLHSSADQADFSPRPASAAAAVCTALAVLLLYLCVRRLAQARLALGSALVLGAATPLWSVSANALWTHPVTVLGLAAAALSLRLERWWWAGAGLGFAMLGRPHIAVLAAVLGILMARWRRDWRILLRIGVPTSVAMGLLSAYAYYVAGTWNPLDGYGKEADDLAFGKGNYLTSLPGFLVAPERGLLVWTPVLLLLLAAVVRGWRIAPDWTKALAIAGACYTLVQIYVNPFGGDGFWAYRHGLSLLVSSTPLVVTCAAQAGRVARALLPTVIGMQFAAIAFGAVVDGAPSVAYGNEWEANSLVVQLTRDPVPVGVVLASLAFVGWAVASWMLSGGRLQRLLPLPG